MSFGTERRLYQAILANAGKRHLTGAEPTWRDGFSAGVAYALGDILDTLPRYMNRADFARRLLANHPSTLPPEDDEGKTRQTTNGTGQEPEQTDTNRPEREMNDGIRHPCGTDRRLP